MQTYTRQSPLHFPLSPQETVVHKGWKVALSFPAEEAAPLAMIDLSHAAKWELYGAQLEGRRVGSLPIPTVPGGASVQAGLVVGLCRPSTALVWQLPGDDGLVSFDGVLVTETTDGWALLAMLGKDAARLFEKVSDLDLARRSDENARLVQGPVLDIPARVLVLYGNDMTPGLLLAVARGYGQSVADAMLDAGAEYGLRPAGENRFRRWLKKWSMGSAARQEDVR